MRTPKALDETSLPTNPSCPQQEAQPKADRSSANQGRQGSKNSVGSLNSSQREAPQRSLIRSQTGSRVRALSSFVAMDAFASDEARRFRERMTFHCGTAMGFTCAVYLMGVLRPVLEPFFECILLAAGRPFCGRFSQRSRRVVCPTRRFQELLSLVAEEHELELQDLRGENQRLHEELRQLRGEAPHPRHPQPSNSPDPLRLTAAHPGPAPPNVSPARVIPDSSPAVEVIIHGAGGLSEALLQANDDSTCQFVTSVGFEECKSAWVPLQRDAWKSAPNMVDQGEQTWEAALISACHLRIPVASSSALEEEIFVQIFLPERKVPFATACLKVGSQRDKWAFDRGGFLDAQ
eukprot:symbB.v1.2.034112.t1/scaffold4348.1/size40831/2